MTKLTLVKIDGYYINADTGEFHIKDVLLKFDPSTVDLNFDFLDAIELALKALRNGTIKPTFVN